MRFAYYDRLSASRKRIYRQSDAIETYERELFPLATLLTPNLGEAARLLGRPIGDLAAMREGGRALAKKYGLILVPFFLKGIVGNAALNQADGIHPTAAGVDVVVKTVLPSAEALIQRVRSRKASMNSLF